MTRPGALREGRGWDGPSNGSIEMGTVGWEDGDDHFELEPGGLTLVKVTLFRGRSPDTEPAKKTSRARGHQMRCRISKPLWFIPNDGDLVHIAIPAGYGSDGTAVIIAASDQTGGTPPVQFGTNGGKNSVLDFGPDARVIIKAGKGVFLSDYEDRWWGVGPEFGIKGGDRSGSVGYLKDGEWVFSAVRDGSSDTAGLRLSPDMVKLNHTAGGVVEALTLGDGDAYLIGVNTYMFSAGVYLGIGAIATNKVAYIALASPVASATVFVAP